MEPLLIVVAGVLAIVVANQLAPRVGVAAPLLLLALAAAVSFTPWVPSFEIDPDLILEVVLPALLFSTAASLPVMDFRREVVAVAGLAVGLVAATAVVLGLVLAAVVPGLSLPWAVALAAVISPTDAVAISIARGTGVSQRVITVLEGEGLFNDASALVLLSAATTAGLAHDSSELQPLHLVPSFALALVVAIAVGWVVGELSVRARARISNAPVDTALTFAIPFLASVPTEHLGGSGLVAAVVAGLVGSYRGPRLLPPAYRQSGVRNWRTVELLLEGLIFLTMGLQAYRILEEVGQQGMGVTAAVAYAALAAVVTIVVRAVFVGLLLPFLRLLGRRRRRAHEEREATVRRIEERLEACRSNPQAGRESSDDASRADVDVSSGAGGGAGAGERSESARQGLPDAGVADGSGTPGGRPRAGAWRVSGLGRRLRRERRRARRLGADLDYFRAEPLHAREGAVIVWAGMRGAITLAAAQTLPNATPMRASLMLIALVVASGSLVIQGLTLPWVIRWVRPAMASTHADDEERRRLSHLLSSAAKSTALSEAIAEHTDGEDGVGGVAGVTTGWSTVSRVLQPSRPGGTGGVDPADSGDPAGAAEATATVSPLPDAAPGDASEELTAPRVRELAIDAIREQREALLDARDEGVFSSATLSYALARLDAEQIMLETHR